MGALHFIGGEKGGVGKSTTARVLSQYFIDRQQPLTCFDTDQSHGSLQRFYAEFSSPVALDSYESVDQMVEALIEQPGLQVVVDLAAQTFASLSNWIEDSALFEVLAEANIPVYYWHVMDQGMESVKLLGSLLERFGTNVNYVLVENHGRGTSFAGFTASAEKQKALGVGARVIALRALQEGAMHKIDRSNASFWAAINRRDDAGPGLGLLERQRVKVWLHHAYAEIDRLGLLAAPTPITTAADETQI